ncbi:MAG: DUF4032 domain-containing protein [Nitriliruptorales bacterium]
MRLQLTARTGHPDFLDLPWDEPLEAWVHERIVEVTRGIHRHVVRFVNYEGRIYALKELPERLARREYRLLRHLAEESLPVVEAVGVASRRDGADHGLPAVLITRHLDFSIPYRALFVRGIPDARERLLDALAGLLVRLHLVGFHWGDCSLSNTLFRRDAGALAAYLVDAETAELHSELTDGQRSHDLEIARLNIAGELFDVEAAFDLEGQLDPIRTADEVVERYTGLWNELVTDEVFGTEERYRIEARLKRVNELGFDVEEIDLSTDGGGYRLHLGTRVVEPGHHRRRLLSLTGLDVQENQARRLLNDIAYYRCRLEEDGARLPTAVVAYRWLNDRFQPTVDTVPADLRRKREPAEFFHEILEHKYLLSERKGRDIGIAAAVRSYVDNVLPTQPDELSMLAAADEEV